MPILKNVEEKIKAVEGFKIEFIQNGTNVRSDKSDIPQYTFINKAPDDWTVDEWKTKRFKQAYPGFDAKVYNSDGTVAVGQKKLSSLRKK